jgi:hypothetical protein
VHRSEGGKGGFPFLYLFMQTRKRNRSLLFPSLIRYSVQDER